MNHYANQPFSFNSTTMPSGSMPGMNTNLFGSIPVTTTDSSGNLISISEINKKLDPEKIFNEEHILKKLEQQSKDQSLIDYQFKLENSQGVVSKLVNTLSELFLTSGVNLDELLNKEGLVINPNSFETQNWIKIRKESEIIKDEIMNRYDEELSLRKELVKDKSTIDINKLSKKDNWLGKSLTGKINLIELLLRPSDREEINKELTDQDLEFDFDFPELAYLIYKYRTTIHQEIKTIIETKTQISDFFTKVKDLLKWIGNCPEEYVDDFQKDIFEKSKEKLYQIVKDVQAVELIKKYRKSIVRLGVLTSLNLNEMSNQYECPICVTNQKDTIIIPCGHTVCDSCFQTSTTCMICRSLITSKLKIFI